MKHVVFFKKIINLHLQDPIRIFLTVPIHQVDPVHELEVVHDGLVPLLHPVEQVAGGHVQEEAAVLVVHHWKRHSNINFGLKLWRRSGKTMFRFFFKKNPELSAGYILPQKVREH